MEHFKIHGAMVAQLTKPDGSVHTTRKDNMILNVGFDFIANAIGCTDERPPIMKGIGVGTSEEMVKASDKALGNKLMYKDAEFKHLSDTKVFSFVTTYEAGEATGAITEAAVMTSENGILLDRVTFSVINKEADDRLTVTFNFTMA